MSVTSLAPRKRRLRLAAVVTLIALLTIAGVLITNYRRLHPAIEWNSDPTTVVLQAYFCCGYQPFNVVNHRNAVVIWGDGRIIWERSGANPDERILTGRLTPDQLAALLRRFVDGGFFGWKKTYSNMFQPTDQASQCIHLILINAEHGVCDYAGNGGAPALFHTLYELAASGTGASGIPYQPGAVYVYAYPTELTERYVGADYTVWPADTLGVSLAETVNGMWLEGTAGAFAWKIVVEHYYNPLVREGDLYYVLQVSAPGISYYEPPARGE